jgi:hypothetical protein
MTGAAIEDGETAAPRRPRLTAGVEFACIVALWIATRPYRGVFHDARLYTVQALHSLDPGRFGQDLFFKYGSQDSFSVFTLLYRPLVASVGVGGANLLATVVGDALWLAAAAWLVRTLFGDRRERLFVLVAIVILDANYGGRGVFTYGEAFATPRVYAEALVMAAMALALRGRAVGAAVTLALAAALHPLVAMAGVGVAVVAAALRDRRVWIAVALAAVACAAAIWLGVGPLGRARQTFDDQWFAIVRQRCDFAFMARWEWPDFLRIAADFALLAAGWAVATKVERRLIVAVAIVAAGGLIVTLVGGDIARNVLIVNLQTWRAMWLAALAANMCVALVVLRSPRGMASRGLFLGAAGAGAAAHFVGGATVVTPVLMLTACGALAVERLRRAPLPAAVGILGAASFALGVWWLMGFISTDAVHQPLFGWAVARYALAGITVAVILLAAGTGAGARLALAGGLVLTGAFALADETKPWDAYVARPMSDDGLAAFVSGAGALYWEGAAGEQMAWFKLRGPSYYSCLQGTGSMFYRDAALDYERRGRALRALNTRTFSDLAGDACGRKAAPGQIGPRDREQLALACRSLPDLDTIILERPVAGAAVRAWRAPVAQQFVELDGQRTEVSTFYRYDCAALR